MEILEVEFTYDKLFDKSQVISFDKNKLCIIGENGVGKTTLLRIIEKILGKMKFINYGYDLGKIDYKIKMSLSKDEFNAFFSQLKYSKKNSIVFITSGDHNKFTIQSTSLSHKFDLVKIRTEQ